VNVTVACSLPEVNDEIFGASGSLFLLTVTPDQVEPQPVVLARTSTFVNPEFKAKTVVPGVGAFPKNDTEVNLLSRNAVLPIDVTELGIDTDCSKLPENAEAPIDVTESGIDTDVNLLVENTEEPIDVIELGSETEVKKLLENA